MPLGFKHVLCGKILFIDKRVFCTAMSFVVVVIMVVVMGDKLVRHSCNMNLSAKHMWSNIIIIYIIQKSSNERYLNRFNNIIVTQLFYKHTKILMHSL
jgi:hypothetical protein